MAASIPVSTASCPSYLQAAGCEKASSTVHPTLGVLALRQRTTEDSEQARSLQHKQSQVSSSTIPAQTTFHRPKNKQDGWLPLSTCYASCSLAGCAEMQAQLACSAVNHLFCPLTDETEHVLQVLDSKPAKNIMTNPVAVIDVCLEHISGQLLPPSPSMCMRLLHLCQVSAALTSGRIL
eukprot:scaffold67763_cov22-Tisochrysis_lutea.AAC.3